MKITLTAEAVGCIKQTMLPGRRLKAFRKKRRWTQDELAKEIGVERSTISLCESGKIISEKVVDNFLKRFTEDLFIPTKEWDTLRDLLKDIYREKARFSMQTKVGSLIEDVTDGETREMILSYADHELNKLVVEIYKFMAKNPDRIPAMLGRRIKIDRFGPEDLLGAFSKADKETLKEAFCKDGEGKGIFYYKFKGTGQDSVRVRYDLDLAALVPQRDHSKDDIKQIKKILDQRPEFIGPVLNLLKTACRIN